MDSDKQPIQDPRDIKNSRREKLTMTKVKIKFQSVTIVDLHHAIISFAKVRNTSGKETPNKKSGAVRIDKAN